MELHTNDSICISRLMNHLGYGEQMVKFRQARYKNLESIMNNNSNDFNEHLIIAGSKAEGLTLYYESDKDVMNVFTDAVCTEYPMSVRNTGGMHVFYLERDNTTPGYTYLRAINVCNDLPTIDLINECLVKPMAGYIYLSSDFLKHETKNIITREMNYEGNRGLRIADKINHGPSTTISYFGHKLDVVVALPCECPSYLGKWINRRRCHQWPPFDVIQDVSSLEAHVVPMGSNSNCTHFLEWRICFTRGEIRLIHGLNDCLTKVLILLKQIAKITLKPLSDKMTSYTMKNVIFWLAELNNFDFFTERNLMQVLESSLKLLKYFVSKNNFPNYMIPERNLLAKNLSVNQRSKICMRIDSLLREGPMMFCRWKKVRGALTRLYRSPNEFTDWSKKRYIVELSFLSLVEYTVEHFMAQNSTAEEHLKYLFRDEVLRVCLMKVLNFVCDENEFTEDNTILTSENIEEVINSLRYNKPDLRYDLLTHFFI